MAVSAPRAAVARAARGDDLSAVHPRAPLRRRLTPDPRSPSGGDPRPRDQDHFDLLGEDVLDREAARRSAEANKRLLRLIPSEIERNISIKLTSSGSTFGGALRGEHAPHPRAADADGFFVRIDMENSPYTDAHDRHLSNAAGSKDTTTSAP